jgi:hypothetical protein
VDTGTLLKKGALIEGAEANVTVPSFQPLVTNAKSTPPAVVTRSTYTDNVAFETCDEINPAGRLLRLNCTSPVYPPPTFTFGKFP